MTAFDVKPNYENVVIIDEQRLLAETAEDFDQQMTLSIEKWKKDKIMQVEIYFAGYKVKLTEIAFKHGFYQSYE